MPYTKDELIPNNTSVLRRLRKRWLKVWTTTGVLPFEALRPAYRNGQYEDGVSLDVESDITAPVGNDSWSNHQTDPRGTGRLITTLPNSAGFPVLSYGDDQLPAHCRISGSMETLYEDEELLLRWAKDTAVIHNPF